MALNQTPAPRLRPTLRERIARQSFADGTGNNLPSSFRGGGRRGRSTDTGVVQGPTREDLEAAQAQEAADKAAAEKAVAERYSAAAKAGSLSERQGVLMGRGGSNPTPEARETFRKLSGSPLQDAYERKAEARRNPNYVEPKIITKQSYKEDLEREYIQNKINEFQSLPDEDKFKRVNVSGSGVTISDDGQTLSYNPSNADLSAAKKYAEEKYADLSIEEKGKLSAAGSRVSAYKFIPETIIATEEFIRNAASGGIIRKDSKGKLILPGSGNNEEAGKTISERWLRTSPVISNILDTKSDPLTTVALNVGSVAIGSTGIVSQVKNLKNVGYTKTQIIEEIAGSLSPLKAKGNTWNPSISKSNFIDNVREVRYGDTTFSNVKSRTNAGDASVDSFIISKKQASGTSKISGISESRVVGMQKRGNEFITVEETTYSTVFGKGKATKRPTKVTSGDNSIEVTLPNRGVSNVNVDPYRKVRTYTDSSGKVVLQEVELLNPNVRVLTRADEKNILKVQAGPLTSERFISTGRSTARSNPTDGSVIAKDTKAIGERFTFDLPTKESDDLADVGKTVVGSGRKSSDQYYKNLYKNTPETPVPIIRPTQPKENPVTSVVDFGKRSKITSASILSTSNEPSIVGGSSTKPSAFAGTGLYERTDEVAGIGIDSKVTPLSFQGQPPATKPRSGGISRNKSSEEAIVNTGVSTNLGITPRTNEGQGSGSASIQLLKSRVQQAQQYSSRSGFGSGGTTTSPRPKVELFRKNGVKDINVSSERFEKLAAAYDVFIKKKGKKVKIAEALPLGLATQTGVKRNLADISASFTLEEVGTTSKKDVSSFIPNTIFRRSKRSKNTFVQIERTRLSGFGERRDIQRAKKRKRGFL